MMLQKNETRPHKIRKRIRKGKRITEKRYGKILVCQNCGKEYFTNDTTIKKRKQLELCQKCVNSGKTHGMWRGGKLKRDGYYLIWIPSHPYCDIRGYVKEHRLIMETYLDRYLNPKEVVHHKNRVRDDNKLENLELFKNTSEHMRHHMLEAWAALKGGE